MFQRFRWEAFALLLVVSMVSGCKKETSPAETAKSGLPAGETILSLHWLGKTNVAGQTNSAYFLKIWDKPESLKLESHLLDRLSVAPLHLLSTTSVSTNDLATETNHPAVRSLRPLLDDLIQNETFLEVFRQTNGSTDFGLAMRLTQERAAAWEKNFVKSFQTLSNTEVKARLNAECFQHDGWTFVGVGASNNWAIRALQARVALPRPPGFADAAKPWLEAEAKLQKLIGPSVPILGLAHLKFTAAGHPLGVRSSAVMDFPIPLPFEVEPWNVPTNIIFDPINSFLAVQGIKPFLSQLPLWNRATMSSPAPNQFFSWGQTPYQAFTYFAMPVESTNTIGPLSKFLLTEGNVWLQADGTGRFVPSPVSDGVLCTIASPLMGPFIQSSSVPEGKFLFGGFARGPHTNQPPPSWILNDLLSKTNAVFYERELTGQRLAVWLYLGQALRVALWKAQIPKGSTVALWLHAAESFLSDCVTVGAKTGPKQLRIDRISSMGLDSLELHLLADWLESPEFPKGLHTGLAPGMMRPEPLRKTNSLPASVTVTNR